VSAVLIAARDLAPAAIPVALLIGFYRQSERRLRAVVDAIPDRMVRFDRDGDYLPDTAAAVEVAEDAMVPSGRQLHEAMFAVAGGRALQATADALDTGRLQAYDFTLDVPGGRRELEARVSPSGPDEVTAIVRDFTEQRAAQQELRQSRTRIVEAAIAERRRLERDLHDGAQQRLVAVSLAIRLARSKLRPEADAASLASLEEASEDLKVALSELRELARGIHPAILTEAGLGPAIDSLAARSTVPAEVTGVPDRRLSPAVESTAYFVVSEALANAAKYASATRATVSAECPGDALRVEVQDDGVGGADPTKGSGLRGLADRVAAIGGSLSVDSPIGGGTRLVAELPLAD
jgi:signal transduction histidine kinase